MRCADGVGIRIFQGAIRSGQRTVVGEGDRMGRMKVRSDHRIGSDEFRHATLNGAIVELVEGHCSVMAAQASQRGAGRVTHRSLQRAAGVGGKRSNRCSVVP